MAELPVRLERSSNTRSLAGRAVAAVLTIIVFVNAGLLFSLEPMFSKLVLPFLGGTPSVWNTCLVFFQAALLAGYGYAHALTRIRNPRRRALVHVAFLALSCLALPLAIRARGDPPPGDAGILWLLVLLVTSLGAPFVMLASGAPLAQHLLADSSERGAANPYYLYAASNLGSLIALLCYPLVVEPSLTLSEQRFAWSVCYFVLVLLIALCFSVMAWRGQTIVAHSRATAVARISRRQRLIWILYSAIPASLLVGVTTFISTDIAAVPLLWVLPLSIYLLTFVIAFSTRPVVRHSWMVRAEPHVLVILAVPIFWSLRLPGLIGISVNFATFFVIAMVCHGELARQRPPAPQLTEFFVWIAVGGLVGGVFNALVAPLIFNKVYEYPIVLAAAALLLPSSNEHRNFQLWDLFLAIAVGISLLLITFDIDPLPNPLALVITIVFGVVVFSFRERPWRFGIAVAAVFAAGQLRDTFGAGHPTILDRERSFFGVYRVALDPWTKLVMFHHGTTLHGAQSLDPRRRLVPLTYYHPDGPAGDVFRHTPAGAKTLRSVGIIGLGAGSLACYGHAGERWTFYEIDPVVARIALDRRFFSFLRDCRPSIRIVPGDGRLTLARQHGVRYDILVLDAFSSDAIPVHLLTREALRLYLSLLDEHGVIALHISNEHLDLEPVVAAGADELRLSSLVRRDFAIAPSESAMGRSQAVWAVLARSRADLGELAQTSGWASLRRRADVRTWTDDFSNIIRVFERP